MKVVVIGGGTAGCISALLFKKKFPSVNLTMIRSKEIGILGPGEGLTPAINSFLKDLDISIDEFILNTGGTIKHGVMFNNWSSDGSSWFHGFYDFYNDKKNIIGNKKTVINNYKTSINLKNNLDEINYLYHLVLNNKINLDNEEEYGYHIDARKLTIFLEQIAEKMGILILDDKVFDVETDQFNNISSIILSDNKKIDCDFVLDCSGFQKLIIGKHYKSEWVSMSEFLPATNAITCFLPPDNNFKPYTDATALKYGWSWKIPLQHRYGCGYVYNEKYVSKNDAVKELIELYGDKLEVVGSFEYKPGFFKETWVNNCFANGLSSSFFEPIEATTISSVISTMYNFLVHYFPKYIKQNINDQSSSEIQNLFNKKFVENQSGLMSLLHLHYRTNRNDTDFWRSINNYPFPKFETVDIERFLNDMNINIYDEDTFKMSNWQEYSWMSVYAGNKLHESIVELDKDDIQLYNESIVKIKDVADSYSTNHLEFLKTIKQMKEKI
jgi:tryptophan halogenase